MPLRWSPTAAADGTKLPRQAAAPSPLRDPYLRWVESTEWRGVERYAEPAAGDKRVQIIARARDETARRAAFANKLLQIPAAYRQPIPGAASKRAHALHFTAWIERDALARLPCDDALRWKLSQPLRDAERVARASTLGRYGPTRDGEVLRDTNVLAGAIRKARRASAGAADQRSRQVIGVIDFGCPFLNPCFRAADGSTRIVSLWDQGTQPPRQGDPRNTLDWPWTASASFGHGRELTPPVLQAMYVAVQKGGVDEAAAYAGIDYLIDYDDPRRRVWQSTHGAHVLDVAAGRCDPLTGATDAASDADIVFVQLPSLTAADSSGASLAGHVLDAVRHVLACCTPQAGVVINLSYGSRAGPHDGSSLLETALDELLEQRKNDFAIVLSAGNSRRQRAHARRFVTPDRSALLRCNLAAGDTTDTFVETRYEPVAGLELRARVRAAGGAWSAWVTPLPTAEHGQEVLLNRDDDVTQPVVGMLRHDAQEPNGARSLVLLAAAPTAVPYGLDVATAAAGVWDIELALHRQLPTSAPGVEIDACIERDDPGQNAGAGTSEFIDQDTTDPDETLGSIATGQHTVVVGGFRRSDGREAEYSSTGTRRTRHGLQPLVLAACEDDAVNPDIAAAAVATGARYRMNGTSVAAPVLARRLFNRLAAGGVARHQWRAVIAELARDDPCVRLPP